MCFFKKKEPIKIDSKYSIGNYVIFKDKKDEVTNGFIYNVKLIDEQVCYDIQIGGECPAVLENIPENKVIKLVEKKNKG